MSTTINAAVLLYSKCHLSLLKRMILGINIVKVFTLLELTTNYLLDRLAKGTSSDAEIGFCKGLILTIFVARFLIVHS